MQNSFIFRSIIFTTTLFLFSIGQAQSLCYDIFRSEINLPDIFFNSQPAKIQKGPSATEPGYILTFANGLKGYFKPINTKLDQKERRYGYQSPYHEVAAYEVSKLFRFFVVPPTILRSIAPNEKRSRSLGSLQLFVEGQTPLEILQETNKYIYETGRIYLFDKLIGNWDRSSRNYIITKTSEQWAIDNAAGFGTTNSDLAPV